MGAFAVLADEAGSPVSVPVTKIPAEFRFSDANPETGAPYYRSRWNDLPDFAAHIALFDLNVGRDKWDLLIEDGEVAEVIDINRRHSNQRWLNRRVRGRVTFVGDWTTGQIRDYAAGVGR